MNSSSDTCPFHSRVTSAPKIIKDSLVGTRERSWEKQVLPVYLCPRLDHHKQNEHLLGHPEGSIKDPHPPPTCPTPVKSSSTRWLPCGQQPNSPFGEDGKGITVPVVSEQIISTAGLEWERNQEAYSSCISSYLVSIRT